MKFEIFESVLHLKSGSVPLNSLSELFNCSTVQVYFNVAQQEMCTCITHGSVWPVQWDESSVRNESYELEEVLFTPI